MLTVYSIVAFKKKIILVNLYYCMCREKALWLFVTVVFTIFIVKGFLSFC